MPKSKATPVAPEGISRELRRFQLLVRLFREYANVNRAEIARRTGIDETHLSKLCNTEKYGYTGLSADIVRMVRDGLQTSPDFFFDPELIPTTNEAELLQVYSLDAQRQKNWQRSVEERLQELTTAKVEHTARLLELQAEVERKNHEILRLKNELAAARGGGTRSRSRTRPPT